jgi:transcriptional regulator with XRE-family HTH domain
MNLKAQLQLELDERGMTAAELARKSGVSKQVLSAWLGGAKPKNIEQLKKVADTLRTSIDHLAFGEGDGRGDNGYDEISATSDVGWIGGLFEVRFRRIKK